MMSNIPENSWILQMMVQFMRQDNSWIFEFKFVPTLIKISDFLFKNKCDWVTDRGDSRDPPDLKKQVHKLEFSFWMPNLGF